MVDLDAIADPLERRSIEAQVLNFGQCPNQVSTELKVIRLAVL